MSGSNAAGVTQGGSLLLQTLPTELFQELAQLLPLCSTAALALTCKSALSLLGKQYFLRLRREDRSAKEERIRFLELLKRDLAGHYACHDCSCLHRHRWAVPKRRRLLQRLLPFIRPRRACDGVDDEAEALLFAGRPINYHSLQAIMREHKLGKDTSASLKRLSCHDIRHETQGNVSISLEFRIVHGEMLMRGTHLLRQPPTPLHVLVAFVYLCPGIFIKRGQSGPSPVLRLIMWILHSQQPFSQWQLHSIRRNQQCIFCHTEVEYVPRWTSSGACEVVITRWLNLGSLDSPYEPKYRNHLTHRAVDQTVEPFQHPSLFIPGSIKAAWGN